MARIYQLQPNDIAQKSYYEKALVIIQNENEEVLKSYDTIMCSYNSFLKKFVKHNEAYSKTTMKHINSFRYKHNLQKLTKKEWEKLPLVEIKQLS